MALVIDHEKCCVKNGGCEKCDKGETCAHCVDVCPVQALTKDDVIKIDEERCILCGACVATCKQGALTIE